MITYEIDKSQLLDLKNKIASKNFQKAIDIALQRIGFAMEEKSKKEAPYKMGNLRRSIASNLTKTSVATGTDLIYAKIQEFGGTITPKKSNFLHFKVDGQWISAKSVKIPARPYLRPALEEQQNGKAYKILTEEFNRILL